MDEGARSTGRETIGDLLLVKNRRLWSLKAELLNLILFLSTATQIRVGQQSVELNRRGNTPVSKVEGRVVHGFSIGAVPAVPLFPIRGLLASSLPQKGGGCRIQQCLSFERALH
jgi:hypothetical protein